MAHYSTDQRGQTVKAWLFAVPLFGATVISITRTMDYRHHWQDVAVGLTLGLATTYFSYRQYYPSLETPRSQYPFTPRHLIADRENTEMNPTHA
jgi:diacylglycerol diphosphate phosphatase / phosphatidate phosphatase